MSQRQELRLDDEQRAALSRVLSRAGLVLRDQAFERFVAGVESSMRAYLADEPQRTPFRRTHDELRQLWGLAAAADPPVGQIRVRLESLEPNLVRELELRAQRLWPKLFPSDMPAGGLIEWCRTASAEDLPCLLRAVIMEGGVMVPGRSRPGGRASPARFEPIIRGVGRGADSEVASNRSGRPRRLTSSLIGFLAANWASATDAMPGAGRSDKTPFGDLVHQVFGWLGLPDATGALRRYWQAFAEGQRRRREVIGDDEP